MIDVQLYTPYEKQLLVHKACEDKKYLFITVAAGRQSGKSELGVNQAVKWALGSPNKVIYWVSPTAAQATKIYNKIKSGLMSFVKSYKGIAGDCEIILTNKSIIKFRSAAQEDSLRGESVHYMILDEAAFIKESVFQEILLPMLNVTGKKCLMLSTPKGKNWLYYTFLKGDSPENEKYISFKFTSADNPYSNEDIIETARQNLPVELFAQEYLAEWVDNCTVFKNVDELSSIDLMKEPVVGERYWAGIDIGMVSDYTVVSIINQESEVVYFDRFTGLDAPALKERLVKTLSKWKPAKTLIEQNNQGKPIYDDLKLLYKVPKLYPFDTTSSSKPRIINNLINAFGSKEIKTPNDPIYKTELEAYTMSISSTGRPTFNAPNGFNDDCVMSLAITWECMNSSRYSGQYNFM